MTLITLQILPSRLELCVVRADLGTVDIKGVCDCVQAGVMYFV